MTPAWTTIYLPVILMKLKYWSVSGAFQLKQIILPERGASIDYRAFNSDTLLEFVVIRGMSEMLGNGVFNKHGENLTLYG